MQSWEPSVEYIYNEITHFMIADTIHTILENSIYIQFKISTNLQ